MSAIPYEAPVVNKDAYNCPHCHAYARQTRVTLRWPPTNEVIKDLSVHRCSHCSKDSFWHETRLLHPDASLAPLAAADMPEDVAVDYNEARGILGRSPRSAAALLRLSIQKLCTRLLGKEDKDLNTAIGSLVKRGLPARVQQALDVVRVVGNNAVHPGQIDLNDDVETARALFGLVNVITDVMIAQPKEIEKLYEALPEDARAAIEKRDGTKEKQ